MKQRRRYILSAAVLLICAGILAAVLNLTKEKTPENLTLAVLPDTQLYTEIIPEVFDMQTQWIVDNAEEKNINFVLHVGDIVNKCYDDIQWQNACNSLKILEDAGIPYIVSVGNHDVDYKFNSGNMHTYYDDIRSENEKFLTYFPRERFVDMPTYGGHSENGYNQYHFVECKDYKILVLALDWLPSKTTMEWTEELLKKYSQYPTIIVKHDFIKPRMGETENEELPVLSCEETEGQWDIFKKYNQIFMIVNGHWSGIDHGVIQNEAGNDVFLSVADFQSDSRGGNGMMQTIKLNFDEGFIEVETFSPYIMQLPEEKRKETDVEQLETPKGMFKQEFDLKERFLTIS